MSVTKKSFIIGAIGLLICICAYIYSQKFSKRVVIDISDYPSFVATDTYTINYGVEGHIDNTMTSTYTEYFDPKQYFTFKHPFLTKYKYEDDAVNLWHIKGEKGHMFVNKLAHIEENVVVYPGFEDTNIKRATSKYFDYDFEKSEVTSEDLVTVYGVKMTTRGTDFSYNLKTNTAAYKGNSHATYYPEAENKD